MQLFLQLFLLSVFLATIISAEDLRYVLPEVSSQASCPAQPCYTISQYIKMDTSYFTTGSRFIFLAGNHSLEQKLTLSDVSDITFEGDKSFLSTTIIAKREVILVFERIAQLKIIKMTFLYNSTQSVAIFYLSNCYNVKVLSSTFQPSSISNRCSAVLLSNTTLEMEYCFFEGNKGTSGAAIQSVNGSTLLLNESSFMGNWAEAYGGAVLLKASHGILISNTFFDNKASDGGAVYANESLLSVVSNMFSGNTAVNGGVIKVRGGKLFLTKNFFMNNTAQDFGGALYAQSCYINSSENHLSTNHAGLEGGAINAEKSYGTFKDDTLHVNTAGKDGGALSFSSSNVTLITMQVFANVAFNGGAVSSFFSNVSFLSSALEQNKATLRGGALYVENSLLIIVGNSFSFNTVNSSRKLSAINASIFTNNSQIRGKWNVFLPLNITIKEGGAQVSASTRDGHNMAVVKSHLTGLPLPTMRRNGAAFTQNIAAYTTYSESIMNKARNAFPSNNRNNHKVVT